MTRLMEGYSDGVYEDGDLFRSLQRQKKEERDNLRHLVDRQERLVSAEPKTLSRGAADIVAQDLKYSSGSGFCERCCRWWWSGRARSRSSALTLA